jgi:hypothetical protein
MCAAVALQASYHVSVLPIAPQYAEVFNETAFWNWFYSVQGEPYGYHTMLYSFIDTGSPLLNLPAPIDNEVITVLLNLVDDVLGNGTAGVTVYSLITWGLNVRLNISVRRGWKYHVFIGAHLPCVPCVQCQTLECAIIAVNAMAASGSPIRTMSDAAKIPDVSDITIPA